MTTHKIKALWLAQWALLVAAVGTLAIPGRWFVGPYLGLLGAATLTNRYRKRLQAKLAEDAAEKAVWAAHKTALEDFYRELSQEIDRDLKELEAEHAPKPARAR